MEEQREHTIGKPEMDERELWFSALAADDTRAYDVDKAFGRFVSRTRARSLFSTSRFMYAAAAVILALVVPSLAYWWGGERVRERFTDIVVEAPLGGKTRLLLPDSTLVWLNAGSRLVYSQGFGVDNRDVRLEGEAYFEVRKNEELPFDVRTKELGVTVLGTKFNVSDYHNDAQSSVTLVKGSVEVVAGKNSTKLSPNQRLAYESGLVDVKNVDVTPYICWKDDIINFNDMKLHDILRTLSRYYNIPIEGIESLDNEVCYGNMDLNMSIDEVLESISHTVELSYRREGNKIIVLP